MSKLAAKKTSLNVSSVLLPICLYLAAQDPKAIKEISNFVFFVDGFAKLVANIFIPGIG